MNAPAPKRFQTCSDIIRVFRKYTAAQHNAKISKMGLSNFLPGVI